jgi:YVTN family beta-propeller protein
LLLVLLAGVASGCDSSVASSEPAGNAAIRDYPTPQGRILTANQAANSVSLIDVATDTAYGTVPTGQQPHHVVGTPDGKEFWVTLYKENRLQVFDAKTLAEVASVDVGASNDDLAFDPTGKRLYVSLGLNNSVAVIDVAAHKMLQTVKVGNTPHGVKVTPDGKTLLVTNTADNTVSMLSLEPDAKVVGTVVTGANPFEVTISPDSKTAYVSNFLGDTISIVDLGLKKTVHSWRSGKQPAMIALEGSDGKPGGNQLVVANTSSADVWIINATTGKLVTRVPVGQGAHGVVGTPSGKLYITNSTDNTVTVIDGATNKAIKTLAVANNPNGLTYMSTP